MSEFMLRPLVDFIQDSIEQIRYEFQDIQEYDDFLKNREGMMKLDAISMRLQAIGETIKNIDKQAKGFLEQFAPSEYWSSIIRMRDIISHHYINIDAEIVYEICTQELDKLDEVITQMQNSL